jgi:hypothetical protein
MKGFIILLAAAAIGYYAYKALTGPAEPESCNEAFNHCMKTCRRTATEAPAVQACQEACKADQAACASK